MLSAKKTYDGKIAGLYDMEETLGRGHFAVVKLARHVFTGEKVAVKVIDKTKLDEVSRAHLFQEVRCMKLVQHPNVVRLYEVIDTQTKLYLILELGDGGDLYDYIMKHETGLGEDMAKEYFRQIVRAISYCHQLHVVHRDLKPENVVFFERLGVVKLTDFGFSNKFCPGQKLDTSCGSLAYSAPEILLGDSYDAPAVDVWSLGVILYMLVAGQAPFQEANDSETLTMIMDCKYTIPTHVSEDCKRLIAKMLVREPESRATLEDIASDPWLGGPPQVEYLPLVTRHQVTEEDHNIIINKMINGNIATKEEVLEALDRNEYNHITATYFLLAERKLRTYRQEQAQNRLKSNHSFGGIQNPMKNSLEKTNSADSAADTLQPLPLTSTLCVPQTPGDAGQGKIRKCSIVQEEEDEEEYCTMVRNGQDLTPPHSSLNRRGSRSEGKLNIVIQERIAEERRIKEKKESPGTSPHPSNVGRVCVKDDASWTNRRTSPTSAHSGIHASYIPGSAVSRVSSSKSSLVNNSLVNTKSTSLESKSKTGNGTVAKESTPRIPMLWTKTRKTVDVKSVENHKGMDVNGEKVITSSQVKTPSNSVSPKMNFKRENSEFSAVSLKDSATIAIPFHSPPTGNNVEPKFKTMPSPTRKSNSSLTSHELFEDIPELSVPKTGESHPGESRINRIGLTSINYEQRKSKFLKARTASCSSSDASDDDSESRKKRAHKISYEKNNQRRDSHDDSSDSQDGGGSGGVGGNPASSFGSGGDGVHNQSESSTNQENRSSGSGDRSGGGSNRNQRQCNGENFMRGRRRTGETRLRESQSLNRIMEVQELEGNNCSMTNSGVFHDRLKNENETQKSLASHSHSNSSNNNNKKNNNNNNININNNNHNNNHINNNSNSNNKNISNLEKGKSGKSLGARFLQSWSNTISSTKLSVQKRKYLGEGRNVRSSREFKNSGFAEQLPKHFSDEKENKALIEKTGKKMKVLGRYFQVSKKICIPLPSLSTKGRLYKAKSCGSIAKDRITSPVNSGTSIIKSSVNGIMRDEDWNYSRKKSLNYAMNQSLDSIYSNGAGSGESVQKSPTDPRKMQRGKSEPAERKVPFETSNHFEGGFKKNVSNRGGGVNNGGMCRMNVKEAAKCHHS